MSDVPDFPINIVAVAGPASAIITWEPPTGESSITGYTVVSTPGNKTIPLGPDVNTYTMTGLTNGVSYRFQVFTGSEIGMSGISSAIIPYPPPRVTNFKATITDNTVTLRWVGVPGAAASPIVSYTIFCSDTNVQIPSVSLNGNIGTCVITEGLTVGTPIIFDIYASSAILPSPTITLTGVIPLRFPDPPSELTAIAKAGSAILSWSAPSNGGTPITEYIIRYNGITAALAEIAMVTLPAVRGTLTSVTVPKLINGNSYMFYILAKTKLGISQTSTSSATITPYGLPGVPVLTVSAGDSMATLTWTATRAHEESPITGYTITSTNQAVTIPSININEPLTTTITGLTNGTIYTFRINSVSDMGSSAIVSKTVTPAKVPDSPLNFVAIAKAAGALLSWSAPTYTGGSILTAYKITYGSITKTFPANTTTALITGLVNGTEYTFSIVAKNIMGDSITPLTSNAITPYALPGAPVVTVVPGDSMATLSWTATPANENSPITGYALTCTNQAVTIDPPIVSPKGISGLTNGTSYTFRINSVSDIGSSAIISKTTLVAAVPDSPTNLVATRGAASAVLSWSAPASNGGAPVTSYVITSVPAITPITLATKILPTTTTISKLTNGTEYTFYIVARNSTGPSVTSSGSNAVTPAAVPAAPRVTGAAGSQRVTLSWPAPLNNGSNITSYIVTSTPASTIPSDITSSPVIIEGLTAGTGYVFTVIAVNSVGNSLPGRTASIRPTA